MPDSPLPKAELERLAKGVSQWIASPEGQEVLRQALERATELTESVQKAHTPDPKSLYEPFTV